MFCTFNFRYLIESFGLTNPQLQKTAAPNSQVADENY